MSRTVSRVGLRVLLFLPRRRLKKTVWWGELVEGLRGLEEVKALAALAPSSACTMRERQRAALLPVTWSRMSSLLVDQAEYKWWRGGGGLNITFSSFLFILTINYSNILPINHHSIIVSSFLFSCWGQSVSQSLLPGSVGQMQPVLPVRQAAPRWTH